MLLRLRLRRTRHARLCLSPYNHAIRCTERAQRCRARYLQAAPPATGVPVVSERIDKAVPAELDGHCIVDNYGSHKHPKVRAWLAARPHWHVHFIPTYSSWLNQVERFFALITDKAIRRGSFSSVKQLTKRIDQFVSHYNATCGPFIWTATADSILEKLHRHCSRISGTEHWPFECHLELLRVRFKPVPRAERPQLFSGISTF